MDESNSKLIFETDRLIVRHYTPDDRNNFFMINGDKEVMRYIRAVKTKEECDKFLGETIASYNESPLLGRWAVDEKVTGTFVGSFAIIPIPDQLEKIQLGYALLKEHWGKGYATELTRAGIIFACDKLGLDVIFGVTEILNVASQRVLLKSGFKNAGMKTEGDKTLQLFSFRQADRKFT